MYNSLKAWRLKLTFHDDEHDYDWVAIAIAIAILVSLSCILYTPEPRSNTILYRFRRIHYRNMNMLKPGNSMGYISVFYCSNPHFTQDQYRRHITSRYRYGLMMQIPKFRPFFKIQSRY